MNHLVPPDIINEDSSVDMAVQEGEDAALTCRATGLFQLIRIKNLSFFVFVNFKQIKRKSTQKCFFLDHLPAYSNCSNYLFENFKHPR